MPRPRPLLQHTGTVSEASSVKVSVGEGRDGRVHAVLDGKEGNGAWAGLLDTLEQALLVSKDARSL